MVTPIDLGNLYQTLRTRVSIHLPGGCAAISLPLPSDLGDELAFYRLVNWGYVLVNEAARIPLAFLTSLPPLRADNSFRKEITTLRTYVAHNLDVAKERDQKTYAFVRRWFKQACGRGSPHSGAHYADCCAGLAGSLQELLGGAIAACDLLDDPLDGPRLTVDLRERMDLMWDAHRFDPIVAACAARLGSPGVDLLAIRSRHLDKWRRVLSEAEETERERVLEQRIEADLLEAIGDVLPQAVRETLQRVAASPEATVAGLLLLRESRRLGAMTLPQIVDLVGSEVLGPGRSEDGDGRRRPSPQ